MTTKEIKQRVAEIEAELTAEIRKGQFVFSDIIREKNKELIELQSQCPHDFGEDGFCTICGVWHEGIK